MSNHPASTAPTPDNPADDARPVARGAWTVALGSHPVDEAAASSPANDDAMLPVGGTIDPLPAGTVIGDYKVLGVLGRGGFGITYRARDGQSNREVAVKEFFPAGCVRRFEDAQSSRWRIEPTAALGQDAFEISRAQFLEGARVLIRFRHSALARAWEFFEAHGTAYLVMELLQGRTLQECVAQAGALDEARALSLSHALCEAVSTLHRLDFLHLDIKPENVMVCASTSGDASTWDDIEDARIVLFDFDLLQRIEKADGLGTRPLTAHCGTPGYAPLEQYAQQAALGRFSDVYALGATLFYLLCAHDPPAAADRALLDSAFDPRKWRSDLSLEVASSLSWAMEMSPMARPGSVEDWLPSLQEGRPQAGGDNDSDAAFLFNAPINPTANSLVASTSGSGMLAGASLGGAPLLPQSPALPPLPIVDSWHQIAAQPGDFEWPYSCACCGRRPDVSLKVRAGRARWNIPYCARCSRHVKAAHQASYGTVWGIVIGLVVAFVGWMMSDFWIGPIGVAIHFSALFYGALKVQAAEALMRPRCCDRKHAIGFGGVRETRGGRKYLVRFRSLRYAHEWKAKNASRL